MKVSIKQSSGATCFITGLSSLMTQRSRQRPGLSAAHGLAMDTSELDGVCIEVDDDDDQVRPSFDELVANLDSSENYSGVEDDDEAFEAIDSYFKKGYRTKCKTLDEVRELARGEPVLSKFDCVKKTKVNPDTGAVSHKTRIILDCKQSMISQVAGRTHTAILPRGTDAIHSALGLLACCETSTSQCSLSTWFMPSGRFRYI